MPRYSPPRERRRSRSRERKYRRERNRSPPRRRRGSPDKGGGVGAGGGGGVSGGGGFGGGGAPRRPRDRSRSRERPVRPDSPAEVPSTTLFGSAQPVFAQPEPRPLREEDFAGKTEEEINMMQLMGFSGFGTTKGKKVENNDVYVAHIIKKRKYRQYMNRRGGFNRPLDPVT